MKFKDVSGHGGLHDWQLQDPTSRAVWGEMLSPDQAQGVCSAHGSVRAEAGSLTWKMRESPDGGLPAGE